MLGQKGENYTSSVRWPNTRLLKDEIIRVRKTGAFNSFPRRLCGVKKEDCIAFISGIARSDHSKRYTVNEFLRVIVVITVKERRMQPYGERPEIQGLK